MIPYVIVYRLLTKSDKQATQKRLELSTSAVTGRRANQLRHTHHINIKLINEPEGIRTPDPRLRRPLLYPAELQTRIKAEQKPVQKRVMGIEPTYSAWKADVLPLNYTRT